MSRSGLLDTWWSDAVVRSYSGPPPPPTPRSANLFTRVARVVAAISAIWASPYARAWLTARVREGSMLHTGNRSARAMPNVGFKRGLGLRP